MKKWLFSLVFLLSFCHETHATEPLDLVITVKASSQSELVSTLRIQNGLAKKILDSKSTSHHQKPDITRATLRIGNRRYDFDLYSNLYERGTRKKVLLSHHVHDELKKWVGMLEKSHYGTPLTWKQMKKTLRRMSYAQVIDIETGKSFQVQRRAGSRHADVQPLTLEDTKIMKEIYKGKWSWKRRAIVISINGKHYAASMHGMPHGGGAIIDNGFPGHFCIHFKDSSTHRRVEPDPSHHLMILKASGQLQNTIMNADPYQLIDYFLVALQEQDISTLAMTMEGATPLFLENISSINKQTKEGKGRLKNLLAAEIPVEVRYVNKGEGEKKETWTFTLRRASPLERWKIFSITTREE